MYKHFPLEKAPTWWGWEHRRCLGSWRWREKPPRPPAQTGRCRREPSLEPEKDHGTTSNIYWIFVFFVRIFKATTGMLFWFRLFSFSICNQPTLASMMDGDTDLQSVLTVTLHSMKSDLCWWNLPHSRLLRLHTYPHSSCEKNHKTVMTITYNLKTTKVNIY